MHSSKLFAILLISTTIMGVTKNFPLKFYQCITIYKKRIYNRYLKNNCIVLRIFMPFSCLLDKIQLHRNVNLKYIIKYRYYFNKTNSNDMLTLCPSLCRWTFLPCLNILSSNWHWQAHELLNHRYTNYQSKIIWRQN